MRIYIAGPMTGLPEWNYPAFHHAAAEWRAAGWDVANPAENFGGDSGRPLKDYVEQDLEMLQSCHAIAMLPGWDGPTARGSVWEWGVARKLLGLRVYDATKPEAPPRMPGSIGDFIAKVVPITRNDQGVLGRHLG